MSLLSGLLAALLLGQTPPAKPAPAPPAEREAEAPAEAPEVKEEITVSATRAGRRLQDEPLRGDVIDPRKSRKGAEDAGRRHALGRKPPRVQQSRVLGPPTSLRPRGRYAQLRRRLPLYFAAATRSTAAGPPLDCPVES